jgi:hypothetical protein
VTEAKSGIGVQVTPIATWDVAFREGTDRGVALVGVATGSYFQVGNAAGVRVRKEIGSWWFRAGTKRHREGEQRS